MEAIEYLKETNRMCNSYKECTNCPLKELASFYGYSTCRVAMFNECEKAISAVDAWSKEHPIVTNAQKFKEVFGGEAIYAISSPNVQALKDWLDAPYKEPEHED